jgi:FAD-linked sulfhydryl oxidase
MPVAPGPSRRFVLLLIAVSAVIAFTFVYSFRSQEVGVRHPLAGGSGGVPAGVAPAYAEIQESTLSGHVIAPKLGNETAKYVAVANLSAIVSRKPTAD